MCVQVMLRQSLYMAIGMYGGICLVAAFFCLLLPIETRGREMKVLHCVLILQLCMHYDKVDLFCFKPRTAHGVQNVFIYIKMDFIQCNLFAQALR